MPVLIVSIMKVSLFRNASLFPLINIPFMFCCTEPEDMSCTRWDAPYRSGEESCSPSSTLCDSHQRITTTQCSSGESTNYTGCLKINLKKMILLEKRDETTYILCLTSRTTVTSSRIPDEDACYGTRNLRVFWSVQKGTPGFTHKGCVLQRVSLGALSDVTVVLGMRQSIVCKVVITKVIQMMRAIRGMFTIGPRLSQNHAISWGTRVTIHENKPVIIICLKKICCGHFLYSICWGLSIQILSTIY